VRLVADSRAIRNEGVELRRTPHGTVFLRVRKPAGTAMSALSDTLKRDR
jgi:hypothetical protein